MLQEYLLENSQGTCITFLNYGGILSSIKTADKDGKVEDILLGFDNSETYTGDHPYMSGIIGRCANRIAKGQFVLDGKMEQLTCNDGENHLHGGTKGFDKVYWTVEKMEFENVDKTGFKLQYLSKEGEEGYPGNLLVTTEYILTEQNEFYINFRATTDKTTIINLTNHPTFNLSGNPKQHTILDHELKVNARYIIGVGPDLIPTGEMPTVENTALDFRTMKRVGKDIATVGEYDHCFVIDKQTTNLELIAILQEPTSGRKMELFSTEVGMQIYSGSALEGITGRDGFVYKRYNGLCLEPQHFPNSPNHSETFPSTVLKPNEKYFSQTKLVFSTIS